MTEIYLDVLDAERKKTFFKLKCLAKKGTLAGGTALTLQTRKRRSFDFDIFFNEPVISQMFQKVSKSVDVKKEIFSQTNHVTFLTRQGVQVTLFYYEFLPLYPKVRSGSLPLFNLKDIAADKAYTLGRRPMWRDYVDLFFLFKDRHVSLKSLIKDAKKKFSFNFAPKLFLEQLTYYKDIKEFKVEFIGREYSPKEIQEFLKKEVKDYARKDLTKEG